MTTGTKLQVDDKQLIEDKVSERLHNHAASAKYRARGKTIAQKSLVKPGDVIFLYSDRSKLKEREKYLVISHDDSYAYIQKFTTNQLRSKKYRVKMTDIITVDSYPTTVPVPNEDYSSDDEFVPITISQGLPTPTTEEEREVQEEVVPDELQIEEGGDAEDEEGGDEDDERPEDDNLEVQDENDLTFQPDENVLPDNTTASDRPRRNNAGKPPARYME